MVYILTYIDVVMESFNVEKVKNISISNHRIFWKNTIDDNAIVKKENWVLILDLKISSKGKYIYVKLIKISIEKALLN